MNSEKYRKDSMHGDSEIQTPVLSQKTRGRIRKKALSGKQKILFDDETKIRKSVVYSKNNKRPLTLAGTSNCKRPSNSTYPACYKRQSNSTYPACYKLDNVQKNKAKSQQKSLIRKSIDADGNESYSNFSAEFFSDSNATDGADLNDYQHSKKLLKSKTLHSSNSLTTKRKILESENAERDTENLERISEERNLELEFRASREERLKMKLGKAGRKISSDKLPRSESDGNAVPSNQLQRSESDGNAVSSNQLRRTKSVGNVIPSNQLRRSKSDGNAVPSNQLRRTKSVGNTVPSDQLRRSKRDRIAPLKYWANERRRFSYNNRTGEFTNLGIDPGTGEDDECQKYLQRKQEQRQEKTTEKKACKSKPKPSPVLIRPTGKIENVMLHFPFDSMSWIPPSGIDNNGENSDYYLSKPCNSSNMMFGFLKIRPHKIKPSQISLVGSIYFQVVKGRVKATIHETLLELKSLDSFIVPKYQTYSIENLLNSNALLSFCAFKVPFFDYEFE